MSKIESRDFWVNGSVFKALSSGIGVVNTSLSPFSHSNLITKITISWEAPEKVVTISESEFERLYPFFPNRDRFEQAKEKLFKDKVGDE